MAFYGLLETVLSKGRASVENISRAMDNHSVVIINYTSNDNDGGDGSRAIVISAYGLTTASNPVIRAYQLYGSSNTISSGWKFFLLDNINYFEETKKKLEDLSNSDSIVNEINFDGDESMPVVFKTYRSTLTNDATNGANVGPKTKEKVFARTSGDETNDVGKSNVQNVHNPIYVDIENNNKAGASFKMSSTKQQASSGPRFPGSEDEQPQTQIDTETNKNVNQKEVDDIRDKVYNDEQPDYMNDDSIWGQFNNDDYHTMSDDEWEQYDKDIAKMNKPQTKRQIDRGNSWIDRSDRSFVGNRRDSGNRDLYRME